MKKTKKQQILDFVEKQGVATFTDIQRFIFDMNYGPGSYDFQKSSFRIVWTFNKKNERQSAKIEKGNPNRGYYCHAITTGCGYLLRGERSLKKIGKGLYTVTYKK